MPEGSKGSRGTEPQTKNYESNKNFGLSSGAPRQKAERLLRRSTATGGSPKRLEGSVIINGQILSASDILKMGAPIPLVTQRPGYICINAFPAGATYDIAINRIDTPEKLAGWIFHLSEKNWFTIRMARELVKVCEHSGVKVSHP